jgi:alpha-glucosidase
MQWDNGKDAGFSASALPWLPVPPSAATVNVKAEAGDPASLLNWHKQLIHLRKTVPALRDGGFTMLHGDAGNVVAYERTGTDSSVIVMCNFSADPVTVSLAGEVQAKSIRTLAQSGGQMETPQTLNKIRLPAYGSWVAEID